MLFPLRAALVIGAIFYFSPVRAPFSLGQLREPATTAAVEAAATLPASVRAQAVRAGLDALAGTGGEFLRAGFDGTAPRAEHGSLPSSHASPAVAPSRDTLHEADRGVPWHGAPPLPPRRESGR
jgi:hypothetical protein